MFNLQPDGKLSVLCVMLRYWNFTQKERLRESEMDGIRRSRISKLQRVLNIIIKERLNAEEDIIHRVKERMLL